MSRKTQEGSRYDDRPEDRSLRLSGQPVDMDVSFYYGVVFSSLQCSRENRSDVCQSKETVFSTSVSTIRGKNLVHGKLYMFHSEGMFETRLFLWFDSQGKGHAESGIRNANSRRLGVSEETSSFF